MQTFDLIIIGAGPAGMAAATTAASHGVRVLLLDEQPGPGGQIYRNITAGPRPWLGAAYAKGADLAQEVSKAAIDVIYQASVWSVEPDGTVAWSRQGVSTLCRAQHVLICTGAQERPMLFPGWTQPGVMMAGAAQILMKTSGLVPKNAVLAGSGPLLYQIAVQMIDAGAPPLALVETQTPADMRGALRHLPAALWKAPGTMVKGMGFLGKIRRARVKRYRSATALIATAQQNDTLTLGFECQGQHHELSCDLLLTHQGVIPATALSRAAGIAHHWNAAQQALQPVADDWGQTDIPGLWLAGDGAGIAGADAAEAAGRLAAYGILHDGGMLSIAERDRLSSRTRRQLLQARSIRPFLDAAYPAVTDVLSLPDGVIACRCEEITCGELRAAIREGANGFRQIKTVSRAGMGPCQGRICDLTVRALLAQHAGSAQSKDTTSRTRWPVKPITLGELAALETTHTDNA